MVFDFYFDGVTVKTGNKILSENLNKKNYFVLKINEKNLYIRTPNDGIISSSKYFNYEDDCFGGIHLKAIGEINLEKN